MTAMDPCYISAVPTTSGDCIGKLRTVDKRDIETFKFPSVCPHNNRHQHHGYHQPQMQRIDTVTGENTNAIALSSRYTPYEWTRMNLLQYNVADTDRNHAEKLRSDAVRILR